MIVFPHFDISELALYMSLLIQSGPIPKVVPVVHGVILDKFQRRQTTLKISDHIVAVSKGVADSVSESCSISHDRITTIYNPVPMSKCIDLATEEPNHTWFSDDGPPIIVSAGRLAREKDHRTLIDAFRHVRAVRPCRLMILGDGPLRNDLNRHIRSHGLEDSVSLPGWVENPYAFMARSALFALSSSQEGFGLVLVEAMAVGCPAVSTDCPGGPSEILQDPALLSPVGDPEALARVILRALDRPVDKTALRNKVARFSLERAMDDYEELIAKVLTPMTP